MLTSFVRIAALVAEILKKLVSIGYLELNKKTQVITPMLLGEMVFDVVSCSIRPLLNAELTASWEKGLTGVAAGTISTEEYMEKLEGFIRRRTSAVLGLHNQTELRRCYDEAAKYYKNRRSTGSAGKRSVSSGRTRRRTGSKKSSS